MPVAGESSRARLTRGGDQGRINHLQGRGGKRSCAFAEGVSAAILDDNPLRLSSHANRLHRARMTALSLKTQEVDAGRHLGAARALSIPLCPMSSHSHVAEFNRADPLPADIEDLEPNFRAPQSIKPNRRRRVEWIGTHRRDSQVTRIRSAAPPWPGHRSRLQTPEAHGGTIGRNRHEAGVVSGGSHCPSSFHPQATIDPSALRPTL